MIFLIRLLHGLMEGYLLHALKNTDDYDPEAGIIFWNNLFVGMK